MKNRIAFLLTVALMAFMVMFSTGTAVSDETTTNAPAAPPPNMGDMPYRERHPAMRAAIVALQKAKYELMRADHDFGGHRMTAVVEIDKTVAELRQALNYDTQ